MYGPSTPRLSLARNDSILANCSRMSGYRPAQRPTVEARTLMPLSCFNHSHIRFGDMPLSLIHI